jgi:S1-C subfamily serine protease
MEGTTKLRAEQVPANLIAQLTDEMLGVDLERRSDGAGFRVVRVRGGSGAERIGLREGDIFLAINGRRIGDDETLRRSVLDLRGNTRAMVMVQRGNGRYNVTIPLI